MHRVTKRDLLVYGGAGLFGVLLFAIGLTVLLLATPVEVTRGRLVWFVGGFAIYTLIYAAAMAVYRGINRSEPASTGREKA